MQLLLFALALACGLAHAQSFTITSTTPNGQVTAAAGGGAIYAGDSIQFVVTAARAGVTRPISAKAFLREYDLQSGAMLRELTASANEANGAYRFQFFGYRVPAATCYPSCRPGQTLRSSEVKVRIEFHATLDYYNDMTQVRTATSAKVPVEVTYPTVSAISVSTLPLNSFTAAVRVTARGARFQAGQNANVTLVKTTDHTKRFGGGSPTNTDPFEYWLLPTNQQQNRFEARVVSEDSLEFSLNTMGSFSAFSSEASAPDFFGSYDIIVRSQPEPPTGISPRFAVEAYGTGLFTIGPSLTDDSTKITKLEVGIDTTNPDPSKRVSATWTPGGPNTMEATPRGFINVKITGTYKLSRYSAGLLWMVMRDKATKQNLYMPWDYARNTAGKERDILEQGYGRHTPVQFTFRLPAAATDLEFFLVLTPQDQTTPTNYDREPTVPFGETFAQSPVVSVTWTKPGDVAIDHIEVVQVIQNDKNEIPLIAGKNTVARVFLKVDPKTADPVGNVSVKLTSPNAGAARRLNDRITVVGEPDRNKFEHSINFALPNDWIKEGELSLDAEVELPPGFTDTKMENNKKTEKVRFIETPFKDRQFVVGYVAYCYQPAPDVARRCPEGNLNSLGGVMRQLYPLAEGRVRYAQLRTKRRTVREPLTSGNASKVMASLNRYFRLYEEKRPGVLDQLVGWLPRVTDAPVDPATDRRLPIGRAHARRSGGTGRVSFVQDTSTIELPFKDPNGVQTGRGRDPLYASIAVAHEVAHNYGLRHPATADSCGSGDTAPDWPKDAAGNSIPATLGEPGFDTVARAVRPSTLKDLMTYCGPPGSNLWISTRHYQKLLTALQGGVPTLTGKGAEPGKPLERERQSLRSADGATTALISGSARRDGSAGRLEPVIRLSGSGKDTSEPNGNHCLVFRNETGTLGQHCFTLTFVDDDPHEATTEEPVLAEEYFSFQVELPAGTNRVDLMAGTKELSSLKAGTGAPVVNITSPQAGDKWSGGGTRTLSWTASAPDGAPLSYSALYSNDGGATWLPLDVDVEETQVSIDTTELDGGANVFFRVIASSGFDSSETTVGPIELAQIPKIEVPAETVDFGHVLVGLDSEKKFEVRSSGTGPLTVNGMAVNGAADIAVVTPAGGFGLGAAETETITLRFTARGAGVQTGTLVVDSNDPANPLANVNVRARAVDAYIPEIAVSPAALDFGSGNIGQMRELAVTVKNIGSALLTVSLVSIASTVMTFVGPARFSLEPGAQQALTVQFRPVAGGTVNSILTIASDDGGRPSVQVPLTGSAAAPASAAIALSPAALDFGSVSVGATKDLPLTVANTGNAELSVTAVTSNSPRFTIVSPASAFRVAAGARQVVTVRFAPTTARAESGELTIGSNDPARANATLFVTGAGAGVSVPAAALSVPASLDFGSTPVGQAKDASITVRNTGGANLSVTALTLNGPAFSLVSGPVLPLTITPGAQQVLNLRMNAAAAGAQSGELRLASNDPTRAAATVTLAGTATAVTVTSPVPLMDSFVPATVTAGEGGFLLTITGSRFVDGTIVNWNGAERTTTFVNSTQVRAAITAADIATPGVAEITVVNPAPGGGRTAGKPLTIAVSGGATLLTQQFDGESCPLLTAYVSAIDRLGNTISSLSSANFRCTEDGQPVNCGAEPASLAGTGLSVAIVIDSTVSSGDLATEKAAATALIALLPAEDRVALVQADATSVPIGGFSPNRASTSGALAAIGNAGTTNALYDAIDLAVRAAAGQTGRRKAVVVMTGSENTAGNIRDRAVMLNSARTAGVPVYVLSFGASANSAAATSAMQQLALDTAGRFTATNGNLALQAERTGQILANQHAVSWSSPNKDGASHLFGLTLSSSQGTAFTSVFYKGCR